MMLIELLVLCRLAVGGKVALQILPSVVSCLRLLTEPLGISKVSSVTLLTISLKVTVTVGVSRGARWVLSNVALMGSGSLVSIAKLLLVGLAVAAMPVASRMVSRLRRREGGGGWGDGCGVRDGMEVAQADGVGGILDVRLCRVGDGVGAAVD